MKTLTCRWTDKGIWVHRVKAVPRFENNAAGALTLGEAAVALGTYKELLRRLVKKRGVPTRRRYGLLVIPVKELRALRAAWKHTRPTTQMAQRVA